MWTVPKSLQRILEFISDKSRTEIAMKKLMRYVIIILLNIEEIGNLIC